MLNDNIKALRKSKGLSQQELAVKLNVVRQTVSKWEQGLSVPDSDMLVAISEVLETPVGTLLGETVVEAEPDALKAIGEKLEVINLQLARRKTTRRRILHWSLVALCAVIVAIFVLLFLIKSPYLGVGLRRTRNRRPWSRVPCIGVAVRQSSVNRPHLRRHWNFYDAKERIKYFRPHRHSKNETGSFRLAGKRMIQNEKNRRCDCGNRRIGVGFHSNIQSNHFERICTRRR